MKQQGRDREEALDAYGYSEDMGMFKFLGFACRKGFKGRATRREFWRVQHALMLILLVLPWIAVPESILLRGVALGLLAASFKAYFCVLVRRLHDIGMSGWWVVYLAPCPFVPQIMGFALLALYVDPDIGLLLISPLFIYPPLTLLFILCLILHVIFPLRDSQRGTNKYGPSYKYPD